MKFGEPQPDVRTRIQSPYIVLDEIAGFIEPATFLDPSFIDAANTFTTDEVKAGVNAWKAENR